MRMFARKVIGLTLATFIAAAACGDDDGNGPEPLPAPTGVTTTQQSLTSIRVSWSAVTGAASYLVQRATGTTPGTFTTLAGNVTATQYDDNTVSAGTTYHYRVAAIAGSDTSAFSSVVNRTIGQITISGTITANRTLTSDSVYVLSGFVKVDSGFTLTIQAGTLIVGDTTAAGSSLFIRRGARIVANGTAAQPIVFTSQRATGNRKPGDWGGIVIVGRGMINRTGTVLTEGPAGQQENYAGGTDNADSSGVLRYVRIEFAGYDVSGTGSELNGLSMYAVGSKTVVEYVQVLAGLDDSFEWWGGAVDARYLVSYEAGDDHFDWSEGYVGRVQHAIGLQSARLTPHTGSGTLATDPQGFEADGCNGTGCAANPHRSTPYSDPTFSNVTMIGSGAVETQAAGGVGAVLRRGTKGLLHNVVIGRWKATGISVHDSVTGNILVADSLNLTDVVFAENTISNYDTVGATNRFGQSTNFPAGDSHRNAATAASIITNLTPASLDWKPTSIAATGCGTVAIPAPRAANFFGGTMTNTAYCGAVDPAPGAPWYQGWTRYAAN